MFSILLEQVLSAILYVLFYRSVFLFAENSLENNVNKSKDDGKGDSLTFHTLCFYYALFSGSQYFVFFPSMVPVQVIMKENFGERTKSAVHIK